ncbi:transposase domain-containing protein, partial [Companilactobacillus nuruki]|uniref:transposase domain-containing protein n=1 Tax=Companilactobacillus nuruki TaxID=1993540 RepID=UPI001416F9CD
KPSQFVMTLIESAKANRINPAEYLTFLLKNISQLPTFLKPEELEAYLPWNFKSSRLKTTNEDNQKIAA